MARKVYRTAKGKVVDMNSIISANEHVRAVGNMSVNARGDKIDVHGNIEVTRSQQANQQYTLPPKREG